MNLSKGMKLTTREKELILTSLTKFMQERSVCFNFNCDCFHCAENRKFYDEIRKVHHRFFNELDWLVAS